MSLNLVTQLFVDGAWTTYAGYAEDGWELSVGPDVETGLRANSLSVTLNNDTLAMDPSRVTSALYGKIGRNTRTRMLINGLTLTQAEASSWQPDATVEHVPGAARGKSWTDLTAEGLLRRLGRWTDPIRSAMTRTATAYPGLLGYWTLEDESGAAQLNNEAASGLPATIFGSLTLAGSEGAGGSAESVKMGSDGNMRGRFIQTGTVTGYQVSWAMKLSAIPASATPQPMMSWVDNAGRAYRMTINNTNFGLSVLASDGTSLIGSSVAFSPTPPTQWMQYMVKVTVSAGTVTAGLSWYPQDGSTVTGYSDTFSSATTGRPVRWTAWGNTTNDGAGYGHVLAISDTVFDLTSAGPVQAFNGYLGETAGYRFGRLMGEAGLAAYVNVAAVSVPMGRQKPGVFLDLIEECVRTEGGMVFDEPLDIALTFVTNRNLVNRTPALNLTKSQVVAPLRKTIDDVGVVNDVTVKNTDGSTARAELTTGSLSTAVPPAGVGRVKGTVEVNMSRVAKLADRANWELRKGTLDRPRYLQVTVDLLANPSLTNTVTNARPGDWITLSGVEPDTITLRVISINRKGGAVEDMATFNCLPAELYRCGVYGASSSRYDSASTTLAAAITTTSQTSLSLTTASYNDRWSSTAVPYDIKIGGERMTVTVMTAGAGTGPVTQTATVTRAVNGVQKVHASGAEVHLFTQVRYALG